jgi:Fe-S-cluster-containing dehydrogenase component
MDDSESRFVPAIYVDRRRCIACNACSLACKQENNFENSPATLARTGRYMAIGQKWTEVYHYEEGTYPAVRPQVFAITKSACTMCAHRIAIGLQPACVITCMGITREFGNLETLKRKYPDAEEMEDGAKRTVLFGNLGSEPDEGGSRYIRSNDCRVCHD